VNNLRGLKEPREPDEHDQGVTAEIWFAKVAPQGFSHVWGDGSGLRQDDGRSGLNVQLADQVECCSFKRAYLRGDHKRSKDRTRDRAIREVAK
jgi:hypothetical protein